MKKYFLLIILFGVLNACSSTETQTTETTAPKVDNSDSTLLAEINSSPGPEPRKIELFNDVKVVQQRLGNVGIGDMRRWWFDEISWISASNYFEFGSPGISDLRNNLAFYLESPSEGYVKTAKLKINIPNMAEKSKALRTYASTAEKMFKELGLTMPKGLKASLLNGKPFEDQNEKRVIKNIFEDGNYDSYKIQIESK